MMDAALDFHDPFLLCTRQEEPVRMGFTRAISSPSFSPHTLVAELSCRSLRTLCRLLLNAPSALGR